MVNPIISQLNPIHFVFKVVTPDIPTDLRTTEADSNLCYVTVIYLKYWSPVFIKSSLSSSCSILLQAWFQLYCGHPSVGHKTLPVAFMFYGSHFDLDDSTVKVVFRLFTP
jgi:hypothetical protein